MYQPELSKLSAALSRSLSAENVNGEKGKGGMDVDGVGAVCARELGQGWKISPYIVLAPGGDQEHRGYRRPGCHPAYLDRGQRRRQPRTDPAHLVGWERAPLG